MIKVQNRKKNVPHQKRNQSRSREVPLNEIPQKVLIHPSIVAKIVGKVGQAVEASI